MLKIRIFKWGILNLFWKNNRMQSIKSGGKALDVDSWKK